jgi:hypothetical protein
MSYSSDTITTFSTGYDITSYVSDGFGFLFNDNNYLYYTVAGTYNVIYKTILTNGDSHSIFTTSIPKPSSGVVVNNTIYILGGVDINTGTGGTIYIVDSNGSISSIVASGLNNFPLKLITDNTYIYVINFNNNTIGRLNITNNTYVDNWIPAFVSLDYGLWGGCYYNNYIYLCDNIGSIHKINITNKNNPIPILNWIYFQNTHLYYNVNSLDLATDGTYLYTVHGYTYTDENRGMSLIDLSSGTVLTDTWLQNPNNLFLTSILINGHTVYIKSEENGTIYTVPIHGYTPPIPSIPIICFLKGSKILTNTGYQPIESLRKGDLVKTLIHGFVPIYMIGYKEIYHPSDKRRFKDQLYVCSTKKYPELFEDLIITGCHSILVDDFKDNSERENTIGINGHTYVTDHKYRLPACVDERTTVYEKKGYYTIFHIALEHDDYYKNYGIYANGLAVETCSKRYLKEFSKMNLV